MSIVFGLAGLLFFVIGIFVIRRDRVFLRNSQIVSGEVLEIKEIRVHENPGYRVGYRPVVKYFAEKKWWFFTGEEVALTDEMKAGLQVKVCIQKGNHKFARLKRNISGSTGLRYLFSFLGAFVTMFSVVVFDASDFKNISFDFSTLIFVGIGLFASLNVGFRVWDNFRLFKNVPTFEESEELINS